EGIWARTVKCNVVDAVADFSAGVRQKWRVQAFVNWFPGGAAVVGAKCAGGGNCDENALWILGINQNGVQAHSSGTWLPFRPGAVAAQPGKFVPRFAAILRTEYCSIFHASVNRIMFRERRLEMPNALELPGMLRTVVPLVSRKRLAGFLGDVVNKFV